MNEIPMSRRDLNTYYPNNNGGNKNNFTYISRWSHIPLPENNKVMKYLKKNFRPLKNLSYKVIGKPALLRHVTPLPNYKPDVVTSDFIKNDLIIQVLPSKYEACIYIHIPKEELDDYDPKCDFSMITIAGALAKEEMFFSEVEHAIRGREFEDLIELAKTV